MAEGNENQKDGQAIRNNLNTAITNFARDLLSNANFIVQLIAVPAIVDRFNQMLETPLTSVLADCTNYGTDRANVTDDLHPSLFFTPVAIPVENVRGDLNGDEVVDIDDVNILINIILKVTDAAVYADLADLNADGEIDIDDVNIVINIILSN